QPGLQLHRMFRSNRALLLIAVMLQACASTTPQPASGLQIEVIEFSDHPDPNTGTSKVVETSKATEIQSLRAAVAQTVGRLPWIWDIRRGPLLPGETERLEETTAKILDVGTNATRVSVVMDAMPTPIEITVPTNSTVVIGSETADTRHAFVAVSVFDRQL